MDNPEVLTLSEAASYLRIDKRTLLRLISARKIKSKKVGGQHRFHRLLLEQYLGLPAQKASG